jgi:hypothetical protein
MLRQRPEAAENNIVSHSKENGERDLFFDGFSFFCSPFVFAYNIFMVEREGKTGI